MGILRRKWKIWATVLFAMSLSACDRFPGPSARNEYAVDATIIVHYRDGNVYEHYWPFCSTTSLGAVEPGAFGVKAKDVAVMRIVVKSNDRVLADFNVQDIERLTQEAEQSRTDYWVFDADGVRFTNDRECTGRG